MLPRQVHQPAPSAAGGQDGQIGLVLNMSTVYPASERPEDIKAATLADGILNRWFIDPAMLGSMSSSP